MRTTLAHYEMPAIDARLQRAPLTANCAFAGPATIFSAGRSSASARSARFADAYWAGDPHLAPFPCLPKSY